MDRNTMISAQPSLSGHMGETYVLLITTYFLPNRLKHMCVEINSSDILGIGLYPFDYIDQLDDIENLTEWLDRGSFEGISAIILNISNYKTDTCSPNYLFRKEIARKLDELNIKYYFTNSEIFDASLILIAGNIDTKEKDVIVTIGIKLDTIFVAEVLRLKNGYVIRRKKVALIKEQEEILSICRASEPNHIIIASLASPSDTKESIRALKENVFLGCSNVTTIEENITFRIPKLVTAFYQNIFLKNLNNFHVYPANSALIIVSVEKNIKDIKSAKIFAKECEILPLKKSCDVSRTIRTFYISIFEEGLFKLLNEEKSKPNDCHRIKIELMIDKNNLPVFIQENFIVANIDKLPEKLNSDKNGVNPVIGFFDNFSVICICDSNGRYIFSKSWNVNIGKDLYLSFDQEKPHLINCIKNENAMASAIQISDLLMLLSMPPDAVKSKETWNFKVIKDDLIEFETSNQRKFVGSPKELMSIVLDSHLNIIKEELGKKMIKKVTFTFFEQFSFEAIEKLGKELEEICKLLQIESCLI